MTDTGGKHNIGLFLALFWKHDSSWKDNSKLQKELFLALFNFDFMAYYVAQCWIAKQSQ